MPKLSPFLKGLKKAYAARSKFFFGLFLILTFARSANAVPDPQDSIIIETKSVNAGGVPFGSVMTMLRVYFSNKDTLSAVVLSLREQTTSGNAFMTLARTTGGVRNFNTVTNLLIPPPQLTGITAFNSSLYHSKSPDSVVIGLIAINPAQYTPSGGTRPLLDMKFDSATGSGTIEFDSIITPPVNRTVFVDKNSVSLSINFVKGQVTVLGPGFISGKKFSDAALNCNPNQTGLSRWPILLSAPGQPTRTKYTDQNGNYSFINLSPGTYTVRESNPYPGVWIQTCPPPVPPGSHTVAISPGTVATDKNFGNHDLSVWDLRISAAASSRQRGTTQTYYVVYRNNGTVASPAATVTLTLPSQVTPPISISGGGIYASGTVTWTIGLVAGGSSGSQYVRVNLPASVPIGTTLLALSNITPTAGDAYLPNNSYTYRATVLGPSPNFQQIAASALTDKTVFPEGSGPFGEISKTDTLLYQINFQNTGTDTVHTVVIRDTLDDYLNIETLEIQASSHLYDFTIDGRELIWTFNNIDLPDSTTDEPGSHAFVTFTVLADSTGSGLDIRNQAAISIDSLPPVATNTVTNRLTCSAKGDLNADGNLTASDVVLELNCAFLGTGNCTLCFADVNCDGNLTSSDVVLELNAVFLGVPITCTP